MLKPVKIDFLPPKTSDPKTVLSKFVKFNYFLNNTVSMYTPCPCTINFIKNKIYAIWKIIEKWNQFKISLLYQTFSIYIHTSVKTLKDKMQIKLLFNIFHISTEPFKTCIARKFNSEITFSQEEEKNWHNNAHMPNKAKHPCIYRNTTKKDLMKS